MANYKELKLRITVEGDISGGLIYNYTANTDLSGNPNTGKIYVPTKLQLGSTTTSSDFNQKLFKNTKYGKFNKEIFTNLAIFKEFLAHNEKDTNLHLQNNAKLLTNRFINKTDTLYILCNPYIISDITNVDCNEYSKIISNLSKNIFPPNKLEKKIYELGDEKATKERIRVLSFKNINLKKSSDNYSQVDIQGDDVIDFIPKSSKALQIQNTLKMVNKQYNEAMKELLSNLQKPSFVKSQAEELIKMFNDKKDHHKHYDISYKYDPKTGIKLVKSKDYVYCSMTVRLTDKTYEAEQKVKSKVKWTCDEKHKRIAEKWESFCKDPKYNMLYDAEGKVRKDMNNNLYHLICKDKSGKFSSAPVKKSKVKTIKELTNKCKKIKGGKRGKSTRKKGKRNHNHNRKTRRR